MPISIIIVSWLASLSVFLYLLNLIAIPVWVSAPIFLLISILFFKKHFSEKITFPKKNLLTILFFIVSLLGLTSFTFGQRYNENSGLTLHISNFHDSLWHVAVISSAMQGSPPENPVFSGTSLSGYHYSYDLVLAAVSYFSGLDPLVLYTFIAPYILALLFAGTSLALVSSLVKDKREALLGSLLITIGAGFAYLAPLFFPIKQFHHTIFWLDQPVAYPINHQLLFSLCVVNAIYFLLFNQKLRKKWLWLAAVLLGSLASIKVYAALVVIPPIFLIGVYELLTKKNNTLFKTSLIGGALAGISLLANRSSLGNPFIWAPGWFVKTMFEAGDHLNFDTWELQRLTFVAGGGTARLALHWLIGLAVFLVGALGVKLAGLFTWLISLTRKKASHNDCLLILVGTLLLSILIPSFLIQDGVVWNSIQFMHYAPVPAVLLLILTLPKIIANNRHRLLLLGLLLLIALPTTVLTVQQNLTDQQYQNLSPQLINNIQNLDFPEDKTIILDQELTEYSLIPALTGRSVYWADPTMLTLLGLENADGRKALQQVASEDDEFCPADSIFIDQQENNLTLVECN